MSMRPGDPSNGGPTHGGRPDAFARPRTFRPPFRSLWSYPFYIWICAVLVWFVFRFPSGRYRHLRDLELMGILGVAILGLLFASWRAWTTRIVVDASGISWNIGSQSGFLRWEEISRWGYRWVGPNSRGGSSRLEIGLVREPTNQFYALPILPRELYELLRTRIGALPPEVILAWFKL